VILDIDFFFSPADVGWKTSRAEQRKATGGIDTACGNIPLYVNRRKIVKRTAKVLTAFGTAPAGMPGK
jgi:hypothetical protein